MNASERKPRTHLDLPASCVWAEARVNIYIGADGGVLPRLAGTRRTFSQRSGVLFLLTLSHDGLASQPLAHGLLVTGSDLLIHLQRTARLQIGVCFCVRFRGFCISHLLSFFGGHGEVVVS